LVSRDIAGRAAAESVRLFQKIKHKIEKKIKIGIERYPKNPDSGAKAGREIPNVCY
jgi:hypothetical protein